MNELELQAIGIGEEQRVVARAVGWILGWWIENRDAVFAQQSMEAIDVDTTVGVLRQMVQASAVAIVRPERARRLDAE